MSQELVHVTVGYPRNSFMDLLKESSHWNGCRFVGLPQHWGSARFSMFAKETMVKAWLETGDIDMDSVVLFTDAYDVLIVEHASAILEKFHATGADLIFAAEPNFFPTVPDGRDAAKAQFDAVDSTWRYLNGGGWIGYAWAVKFMVRSYQCLVDQEGLRSKLGKQRSTIPSGVLLKPSLSFEFVACHA